MNRLVTIALGALLCLSACGDDSASDATMLDDDGSAGSGASTDDTSAGSTEGTDAADDDQDAADATTYEVVPRDPPAADAFEDLMAYEWELEGGEEQYYCIYQTVEDDLWVSAFEPIQELGTHHVTLGFVDEGPPDGVVEAGDPDAEFPCDGITLGDQLVFGAVFNTPGMLLPEGTAARVPAGTKLLLSVHVLNPTEEPLSGRTGVSIVQADPAEVVHEVENIFAMNISIQVEPGASTALSHCTMPADGTILALTHHMHLTGVHQKTTLVRGDGSREILHDAPFVFDDQATVVLDPPVRVAEGDELEVECQFENGTDQTLYFGESTRDSEMCLTSFYRFPAAAESFICVN